MNTNTRAICSLTAFHEGIEIGKGIKYLKQLDKIDLNYSTKSIQHLDKLLVAIGKKTKPDPKAFLTDQTALNFLYIVSFYIGEWLGRVREQPPQFYSYEELSKLTESSLSVDNKIENSLGILFLEQTRLLSRQQLKDAEVYFPVKAILRRVFMAEDSQSLLADIRPLLGDAAKKLDSTSVETPYPPYPPLNAKTNIHNELAQLKPKQYSYLQTVIPKSVQNNPLLYDQINAQAKLYAKGRISWGAVIMADEVLYHPSNRPGFVRIIYDPTGRVDIESLRSLAYLLTQIEELPIDKVNTLTEQDQRDYYQYINCHEYLTDYLLPKSLAPLALKITDVWIWRLHLPNRLLSLDIFPILVLEEPTPYVSLVPARFWGRRFYQHWLSESEEPDIEETLTKFETGKGYPFQPDKQTVVPALSTIEKVADAAGLSVMQRGDPAKKPQGSHGLPNHRLVELLSQLSLNRPLVITTPLSQSLSKKAIASSDPTGGLLVDVLATTKYPHQLTDIAPDIQEQPAHPLQLSEQSIAALNQAGRNGLRSLPSANQVDTWGLTSIAPATQPAVQSNTPVTRSTSIVSPALTAPTQQEQALLADTLKSLQTDTQDQPATNTTTTSNPNSVTPQTFDSAALRHDLQNIEITQVAGLQDYRQALELLQQRNSLDWQLPQSQTHLKQLIDVLKRSTHSQNSSAMLLLAWVFAQIDALKYQQHIVKLVVQSANLDDPRAQKLLSELYFKGFGVDQDFIKGNHWLDKAAANNHPKAINIQQMMQQSKTIQQTYQEAVEFTTLYKVVAVITVIVVIIAVLLL